MEKGRRVSAGAPMELRCGDGDESGNKSSMRSAETLLRLLPVALCTVSLVVMLKNSQTSDIGTLSYSDLGAFRYSSPLLSIIFIPVHHQWFGRLLFRLFINFHQRLKTHRGTGLTLRFLAWKISFNISLDACMNRPKRVVGGGGWGLVRSAFIHLRFSHGSMLPSLHFLDLLGLSVVNLLFFWGKFEYRKTTFWFHLDGQIFLKS